ncbi:methyltransferase domain-containing protein [Nitratifractor sp.]
MAVREFDRFAESYGRYNLIQRKVARRLVDWIDEAELGHVIDLGAGSGEVLANLRRRGLTFKSFIAADLSENMLRLHPAGEKLRKLIVDFNDPHSLCKLQEIECDTLLSSSALQWSHTPEKTFGTLATLGRVAYFSIFTSGTFRTLLQTAGLESPIHDRERIHTALKRFYRIDREECIEYRLQFESALEMFRYIKRSGVSGGDARLDYRKMKTLMREYPHDFLEFEVLFYRLIPKTMETEACIQPLSL